MKSFLGKLLAVVVAAYVSHASGHTALWNALIEDKLTTEVLRADDAYFSINVPDGSYGCSALFYAIADQNWKMAELLLRWGADPNSTNNLAFHYHEGSFVLLTDQEMLHLPTVALPPGSSILHALVLLGPNAPLDLITKLFERTAEPLKLDIAAEPLKLDNPHPVEGWTPLFYAMNTALSSQISRQLSRAEIDQAWKLPRALIDLGADPNFQIKNLGPPAAGWALFGCPERSTIMHLLADRMSLVPDLGEIFEYLLDCGADVFSKKVALGTRQISAWSIISRQAAKARRQGSKLNEHHVYRKYCLNNFKVFERAVEKKFPDIFAADAPPPPPDLGSPQSVAILRI